MTPILLVENEAPLRKLLKCVVAKDGFPVREAENGVEALAVIEELKAQVCAVVTTLHMPNLDGASLCRIVKRDYPSIPVLLISGNATPEEREVGDAFLEKPFDPVTLMAAILGLLQTRPKAAVAHFNSGV